MLASHTYRCIGGPKDGATLAVPSGASEVRVILRTGGPVAPLNGPASPVREQVGVYRAERHATHGYVLRWHEPTQ